MSRNLGRNVFGHAEDAGKVMTLEEGMQLLKQWVENPRLQLHMRQVAHLMKCWAAERLQLNEQDQHRWYMAGLLHDADWEKWPDEHCGRIVEELEKRHQDPEIIHAIASHGPRHFGVMPVTQMDKMLYVFDELSGLIHAYSLMRPEGYAGMEVKGVMKRFREKKFAANVSREEIMEACGMANLSLEDVIAFIIPRQAQVA
ncbi:HD domain-containing protein [Thermoflavifilum thermophilum]|uniref:Predicted hydrolase, HD superfamily n=1 Tax=Thermoflavifilum thermophilum TaxID=1393122 RepID=A0A1I7MX57_9BACT|nr:HD domain-containing protein [Thermoflavifilum thermophilum]SFV26955.1 Predicted hydrolase, HD superfamily [Thermoflavifilum thermophilum]